MTIRDFIRNHRADLEKSVRDQLKRPNQELSTEDLRQWILNYEPLYNWARSEHVKI